jgi:hypothetical protein
MRRGLAAAVLASVFALTAGSAPAKRAEACTWGASSITAQYVDGKLVESEPVTTGCAP